MKYDEALGEYNWTGPQRTVIDNLREKIKVTEDPEKRQHYLDLIEEITKEIEERQKEKDRVAKKAKELEEKIKAERARFKSIEKKEEKDYYTYGYDDGSYEEDCVRKYIQSLGVNCYKDRILQAKVMQEIDMYIPQYNIGIEYNGSAFHASLNGVYDNKDKY